MTLSVSNLHVSYGKRHPVINGLDLTVPPGRLVGVLGPNGSGKSTLILSLAGIQPHRGSVTFAGVDGARLREITGYMPQEIPGHVALTVLESVLVACRTGRVGRASAAEIERGVRVLHSLGIGELCHRFLGECSGGQRQLVSLAQALVREPQLLLLDEPTSALDLRHQRTVFNAVRCHLEATGADRGLALVAVHDLNLAARYCDHLVLMRDGGVRAEGTPDAVLRPDVLGDVYDVDVTVGHLDGRTVVSAA